ncbi:class I SAM-dependent methyltransferase [Paenibacillus roseipurpureus]|uniref:SAM-dependent methyltransferase n=1 Tax=Paenibacillus roseopurpureus TaxID=2918901 RepID=A0AA96LXN0_9BACL|nr:SAM-dependent methyltransferase [Paenibacillus sp. MBLB1832]WNR46420.1 SAM-dependent methyltransferase [Paenibacillus sp. MBLB1832]
MTYQLGHSGVVAALQDAIQSTRDQRISFRDYMDICLYQEPHGYYRNQQIKIGKQGDFYTSSSIGTVMGEMIAAFVHKQLQSLPEWQKDLQVVEWGGGNGRMAKQMLDELRRIEPAIYGRTTYTLIESSPYHRQLQAESLSEHIKQIRFIDGAVWLQEEPEDHVYVLANELVDAFPVHRIRFWGGEFQESFVSWHPEEPCFREDWFPLEHPRIVDYLESLKVQWSEGQIAEINLAGSDWIRQISARIRSGSVIMIDYGDVADEIFGAHRHQGTLMCYRKHEAHDNPFIYQGEQDITAHVDFSSYMKAAAACGFEVSPLQTQRQFLVEQGILEKLQNHFDPNPFSEVSKRNRTIRQLLLSDGMSELFKVCIVTKKGGSAK